MTEENPFARFPVSFRRRKRSVLGRDWQTPTMQDAGKGVWCRFCGVRHPYMGAAKLERSQFERVGDSFTFWWVCPKTGNYLQQVFTSLTGRNRKEEVTTSDKDVLEERTTVPADGKG